MRAQKQVGCNQCDHIGEFIALWATFSLPKSPTNNLCKGVKIVGPGLTEFRIDQMAFGQPECTCLNIQNVTLL